MKLLILGILAIPAIGALSACVHSAIYTARVQDAYPPIGEMVDIDGSDVHVIRQGEIGPVVLMIHGASANAREFTYTLAPRLAETHRVLMVDRPGHGYSDRPENSETLGKQAELAAGVLKALAPNEKAVVVGHSFGGGVALRMGLDYPELTQALVLLAPVSHDWGGGGEAWYNGYAASPFIGSIFTQLVPIVGPAQVKAGVKGVFSPQPAPEGYYEDSAIGLLFRPPEFRANAKDVNVLRFELGAQESRYGELDMPVVVYSGAKDTVINPSLHVGKLKHQVPQLDLVALSHEGHMPHHGEGEAVAARIRELSKPN